MKDLRGAKIAAIIARNLEYQPLRQKIGIVGISVVLAAFVVFWRFQAPTDDAILIFLVVPLALIGAEFGAFWGAFAAILAITTYTVWSQISIHDFTWTGFLTRLSGFVVAGALMGLLADAGRILRYTADHDLLTGLLNRRRFHELLAAHEKEVARYGNHGAVLFMDLDEFKEINDRYGHDTGDKVLEQVADVLRRRVRASDHVARLGGDEFAVLLPRGGVVEGRLAAEGIAKAVAQERYRTNGVERSLTVSVGVAPFTEHGMQQVLIDADKAMYVAKREGGGVHVGNIRAASA